MIYLLIVSIIWAFSFGLIKDSLTGINPVIVAFLRLFLSALIFLPFLKIKNLSKSLTGKLILTGAVQYGLMYTTYIYSFQFLKAYEVALFTVLTPFYVVLISNRLSRKSEIVYFLTATMAVAGAGIIVFKGLGDSSIITGFIVLQISNFCFASGQVYYKHLLKNEKQISDLNLFALLYVGGLIFTGLPGIYIYSTESLALSSNEIFVLLYLGVIASGLGFFLWNYGARKTNTGALAIFNNLKIPVAIIVSVTLFGEDANIINLLIGGIIIIISLLINQFYLTQKVDKELLY
jgi:drug/metabolite transporter (DMT)-like permease